MPENRRMRSAPTPVLAACNSPSYSYDPCVAREAFASVSGVPVSRIIPMPERCMSAIYVILIWNMRAREYLNLTMDSIYPGDIVLVNAAKGSQNYLICLPGVCAQTKELRVSCPGMDVAGVSYMQLYRACVAAGIGRILSGHKNATRTHIGRHNVNEKYALKGSEALGDLLHHRSLRSRSYYTGEQRSNDYGHS